MPTSSKKVTSKKGLSKQSALKARASAPFVSIKNAIGDLKARRPHRSFQLTRRRDYVRELELPGYVAFTHYVNKTLWGFRKLFIPLTVVYILLYAILVGVGSQDTYSTLSGTLQEAIDEVFQGDLGAVGQAGVLFLTIVSSSTSVEATEAQQIFSVFIFVLIWLTTVWLLRNVLAGHRVKLRDGFYNSGGPIFATVVLMLVIAVQLLPAAAAVIGYTAAEASGLIAGGGAPAMLFWIGAALLVLLSLYWITSSLFAMIIVTLPGMYPLRALKTSGDMVLGRRTRILLRWLWMALMISLTWALVIIPFILIDMGLKSLWPAIEWVPIVPTAIVVMSAISTVWVSSYVYLLYRKVVDNERES